MDLKKIIRKINTIKSENYYYDKKGLIDLERTHIKAIDIFLVPTAQHFKH